VEVILVAFSIILPFLLHDRRQIGRFQTQRLGKGMLYTAGITCVAVLVIGMFLAS
jgi:hypothetical protein